MADWTCAIANRLWLAGNLSAAARFQRALARPETTQRQILAGYLKNNADTLYGRQHQFAAILSVEEFQERLPITTHEDYQPYIDRIAEGESQVLTREPVRYFALTSGSTRAEKWIPYTKSLLAEFSRGIAPWIANLFHAQPHLMNGPAYWSVTPAGLRAISAPSKVPVGFDDDSAYVGGLFRRMVNRTLAVPAAVRHLADMDEFRYATLLHLLRARELRIISIWHPSFLGILLSHLPAIWDRLLADLRQSKHARRAAELARLGPHNPALFWPNLGLISCWTSAHAQDPASQLATQFPCVLLQGKGLISTEAFASLPLLQKSCESQTPLAIRSHFFEFLPDSGRAVMAHEAEIGDEYTLILTTGGGFYRYNTHDRIRITARLRQTPCLEFLGKEDHISDRRGEKLNALFVAGIIARWHAALALPRPLFAMLAPDGDGYTLFLQCTLPPPPNSAFLLDELLRENPHYHHCRKLHQFAAARLFLITGDAAAQYLESARRRGQRLGNIKPACLHAAGDWRAIFSGQ